MALLDSEGEKVCGDKECRIKTPQRLAAFPKNKRNPDKRNRYCLVCSRRRVYATRASVRAIKAGRKARELARKQATDPPPVLPLPPCKRRLTRSEKTLAKVWTAIALENARTQKQIKTTAHLHYDDELGDALANLILNFEFVKSELTDVDNADERIYFPNPKLKTVIQRHEYSETWPTFSNIFTPAH